MPDSYENLIKSYEDLASGYNEMDRSRKENYAITRGGTTNTRITPGGTTYGGGVPGTVVTIGTPPGGSGRGGMLNAGGGDSRISRQIGSSRNRSPASAAPSAGIETGYQGPNVSAPVYKPSTFNRPDPYKAPGYKPPERDPGVERKYRQEYMGPGMRQVRKGTSEAMISSRSLDNPNARALFVEKALSGVGEAVSTVAATAGKEARTQASNLYREDLEKYNFGFKSRSEEAKVNYTAAWDEEMLNFQEKRFAEQARFNQQQGVFNQMPLSNQAGEFSGNPNSLYQSQLSKQLSRTWG